MQYLKDYRQAVKDSVIGVFESGDIFKEEYKLDLIQSSCYCQILEDLSNIELEDIQRFYGPKEEKDE